MPAWRILNLHEVDHIPTCLDPLRGLAEVVTLPATLEALQQELPRCDGYLCALKVRLTRDLIAAAPRLRVVATSSTGLDHLDLAALEERGIHLISLKYDTEFLSQITATAELAWGLLLAVVRRLPWGFAAAQRGEWGRDRFRGHQLRGMTLGILGYGRLGRIVADYGQAFRMRVIACEQRPDADLAPGVERVDFETLLRESDVLSIHIHLTPENTRLIDAAALARMKRGAYLINTSRGGIVDEAALLDALASGHLGGAGLDVIDGEWRLDLSAHPLIAYSRSHENLVISPHVGGITVESQGMAMTHTCTKLAAWLRTQS